MKYIILFLVTIVNAADLNPDVIVGTYLTEKKDAKVCVYKEDDTYSAKLCWLSKPEKDTLNPDIKLRQRDLLGLRVGSNFKFNGKSEWSEGSFYDPESGDTYTCKIWIEKDNLKLNLRCYVGISLFGRTEVLTRTDDL